MSTIKQDLMKYLEYVQSRQDLLSHIIDDKKTNLEDITLIKEKQDALAEPVNLISKLMTKCKLLEDSLELSMNINKNLITNSEETMKEHSLIEPYRSPIKAELQNKRNEYLVELVRLGKEIDKI